MKIIIPMGGKGTRLRPHTLIKPKPLVHVAGKPMLGHILDKFKDFSDVEEIIFITGGFMEQIQHYVQSNYSFNARFIPQKEALGVAHALYLAKDYVKEDVLVVFSDTLFEADFSIIGRLTTSMSKPISSLKSKMGLSKKIDADGIIWVKEVDDPRRFGVAFLHQGYISKIIEKPQTPVSNLALIGLYYLSDGKKMMDAIDYIISNKVMLKNEFFLTDALQVMINSGSKLIPQPVGAWLDCGTVEALLETNTYLLQHGMSNSRKVTDSVIIPPVFIEDGAQIINSVVGPNASIATGAVIKRSIVKNSIVNSNAVIVNAVLDSSLIGSDSIIKELPKKLNMGDSSEIIMHQEAPQPD